MLKIVTEGLFNEEKKNVFYMKPINTFHGNPS